jgi:sugar/nucleoside kinase (ribokinase family)
VIVVVGAAAVDVLASRERFLPGTSNPAAIRWAAGGVGYRIWRRLPEPRLLLSAAGEDPAGDWLQRAIAAEARGRGRRGGGRRAGQPAPAAGARLLRLPRLGTACYCALMQSGRLLYGAADMAVIERGLTLARLGPHLPALGPADLLVLEANLAPALVASLLRRLAGGPRVVFEGVSVEKLLRHAGSLRDLYLLSVNQQEAAALASLVAPAAKGTGWVAPFLRERRIAHLLVPRGRRGAVLHALQADGRLRSVRCAPGRVVGARDSTGAGDRLLAAVLARVAGGASPARALRPAMREVERALEEGSL